MLSASWPSNAGVLPVVRRSSSPPPAMIYHGLLWLPIRGEQGSRRKGRKDVVSEHSEQYKSEWPTMRAVASSSLLGGRPPQESGAECGDAAQGFDVLEMAPCLWGRVR